MYHLNWSFIALSEYKSKKCWCIINNTNLLIERFEHTKLELFELVETSEFEFELTFFSDFKLFDVLEITPLRRVREPISNIYKNIYENFVTVHDSMDTGRTTSTWVRRGGGCVRTGVVRCSTRNSVVREIAAGGDGDDW